MKKINSEDFLGVLHRRKQHYPWHGQIELTYGCNLNCIHCYCKGSEKKEEELSLGQWKKILDEIKAEGCVYLTLSGGEPLIREDFLELYAAVKENGFIITLFTNGLALNRDILEYLTKYPPYSLEITLNGITASTYEAITQVPGSFALVMQNIRKLKKEKLPLTLKANCLKENKDEIAKVKSFADKFLGKKRNRFHFKFSQYISPCLNCAQGPLKSRLSFNEILKLKMQDPDIWHEYQRELKADLFRFNYDKNLLYHCNTWLNQFFIDPYGRLKFCVLSPKFAVDLKSSSFKQGFYKIFPQMASQRFKSDSKCINCRLRPVCYHCPARAFLETGDEEAPVPYFCSLAKESKEQMEASGAR